MFYTTFTARRAQPALSLLVLSALLLPFLAAPAVQAQSSRPGGGSTAATGISSLGIMSRLRDAAERREASFASLKVTYRDGTLSTTMEKFVPSALFVRAKIDGKPIKIARGQKAKHLEGVELGSTLWVDIERPVFSTRQRGECTGLVTEGAQEVLIYPGGEEGVACTFFALDESGEVVVSKGPNELISEWEKELTFEQFELVGKCQNEHERGSVEYWTCVEEAGVPTPKG